MKIRALHFLIPLFLVSLLSIICFRLCTDGTLFVRQTIEKIDYFNWFGRVKPIYPSHGGNDFILNFNAVGDVEYTRSAGIILDKNNKYRVIQQSDAVSILREYGVNGYDDELIPSGLKNGGGGIKKIFMYEDNVIALFALQQKYSDCKYAVLINLTSKKEFFRGDCLPESVNVNFDGIGGGHTEINGDLLVAIGTPTTDTAELSGLAQDLKSPYGKILRFKKTIVENGYIKSTPNFSIYSMGHRNPQGMLNFDGRIISVEHGPRGGDEINIIKHGKNYGWPVNSFGSHYDEPRAYSISNTGDSFELPIFSFIPSIGISSVVRCPEGLSKRYEPLSCILVGSLRGNAIFIALIDNQSFNRVLSIEKIPVGMRVREILSDYKRNKILFTVDGGSLMEAEFTNFPN